MITVSSGGHVWIYYTRAMVLVSTINTYQPDLILPIKRSAANYARPKALSRPPRPSTYYVPIESKVDGRLGRRRGNNGISYRNVNKTIPTPQRNMSPPKGRCCECSVKIFENTRIYI